MEHVERRHGGEVEERRSEGTQSGSGGEPTPGPRQEPNWRRPFNRWAPLVVAGLGMLIVGLSIPVRSLVLWYGLILLGFVLILGGFWYRENPVLTSERRFHALRGEVSQFIGLVRTLNRAAERRDADELDRVKVRMHESVERMADVAAREGKGS